MFLNLKTDKCKKEGIVKTLLTQSTTCLRTLEDRMNEKLKMKFSNTVFQNMKERRLQRKRKKTEE